MASTDITTSSYLSVLEKQKVFFIFGLSFIQPPGKKRQHFCGGRGEGGAFFFFLFFGLYLLRVFLFKKFN